MRIRPSFLTAAGALLLFLSGPPAHAQGVPPPINSGDTAFVLVAAALVMLMTPGLALFYGGMVRRKNAPSMAAATVPEYRTSSPRFGPSFTPETTMSCGESNKPEMARCTQSVGVPGT